MSRKTRSVTSREYKVMLKANRFRGSKREICSAAEHFLETYARDLRNSGITTDIGSHLDGRFEPCEDAKQVLVQFFDTKQRSLRNSDFIFRKRQPIQGGPLELTLKRRHADRFYVSGSKTGGTTKFEEDIKTTRMLDWISLYSLSGKVKKVDADTKFETIKDIQKYFKPLKKQMGRCYDASEKLLRVCDFIAIETVLKGVCFSAVEQTPAECALIIWHQKDKDPESPAVVEFSFRYDDKMLEAKKEPFSSRTAKYYFDVLQVLRAEDSPVARWIDLDGPTKTSYAYNLTRS